MSQSDPVKLKNAFLVFQKSKNKGQHDVKGITFICGCVR